MASCQKEMGADNGPINIDVNQRSKVSDFFDSYHYVKLETNDEALIGRINKIRVSDSVISVLSSGQIFNFDHSGRYIGSIDRKGQGPHEYIDINDFLIREDQVMVLSGANKKIFIYDFRGSYIREIPLESSFRSFAHYKDNLLCLASENMGTRGSNFIYINADDGNVISEFDRFDSSEGINLSAVHNVFLGRNRDGNLIVAHPFDMTIYRLSELKMEPAFTLNFNTEMQLPGKYLEKSFMELSDATNNNPVVRYFSSYYEGRDFMIIAFPLFGKYGNLTNLVKIKDGLQIAFLAINEKIDADFPYISTPLEIYGEYMVSVRDPERIQYIESHNNLTEFKNSGLTDSDNPVVFFHHIRQ